MQQRKYSTSLINKKDLPPLIFILIPVVMTAIAAIGLLWWKLCRRRHSANITKVEPKQAFEPESSQKVLFNQDDIQVVDYPSDLTNEDVKAVTHNVRFKT